jgi:aspartyl/asparaginyl-tRNA synthetase
VRLNGWVDGNRHLGGLLFIDLRDRYGVTQVVINPQAFDAAQLAEAERCRAEFVVAAIGVVQARPEGTRNPKMPPGDVEVVAEAFHILSESKTPPFEIVKSECQRSAASGIPLSGSFDVAASRGAEVPPDVTMTIRNYMAPAGISRYRDAAADSVDAGRGA